VTDLLQNYELANAVHRCLRNATCAQRVTSEWIDMSSFVVRGGENRLQREARQHATAGEPFVDSNSVFNEEIGDPSSIGTRKRTFLKRKEWEESTVVDRAPVNEDR